MNNDNCYEALPLSGHNNASYHSRLQGECKITNRLILTIVQLVANNSRDLE